MATSKPAQTTTKPVQTTANLAEGTKLDHEVQNSKTMEPVPVMSTSEVKHFQDLGLGRGIDSSDPQLWKNKTPMQIRSVNEDLSNIIATDESGVVYKYKKVVSSLKTQQTKIQTSLSDPSSIVKIGLDAHYSQSATSTITIKGTRVQTRTVSFRYEFEDLPVDSDMAEIELRAKTFYKYESGYSMFENNLAVWLLAQFMDGQKHGTIPPKPDIRKIKGKTPLEKLAAYVIEIPGITSEASVALNEACRTFMFEFGITHYVSSIQLGALKYSMESRQTQTTGMGIGGNIGVASKASASASTDVLSETSQSTSQENDIGNFNEDGVVRRDTSDEAVIGFELQPISKLMRLPVVQTAMTAAIQIYLNSKTDDIMGPHMISTTINEKPVYWKVNQEQLIGTEDIKEASLFYFVSDGDEYYPSNFSFAYWGDKVKDRKLITEICSRMVKLYPSAPKLPLFLTTSTSGSLLFKYTFDMKTAQYTIHSRVYNSRACFIRVRGPASLQTWLEGDEFYIKHHPHALKSEYLALQLESTGEQSSFYAATSFGRKGAQSTETQSPTYSSTTFSSIKNREKKNTGMLFRLHPYQLQAMYGRIAPTEEVLKSLLPGESC